MIRPLVPLLLIAPAALAPPVVSGTASAADGSRGGADSAQVRIEVAWPAAPVRSKRVTVHVTRTGTTPVRAELQVRRGTSWWVAAATRVTTRSFTLTDRAAWNRYRLRVVLKDPRAVSRVASAPQPAALVRDTSYRDRAVQTRVPGQQLRLRFEGRRGHRVHLATLLRGSAACSTTTLRHEGGRVRRQDNGLWRLPRTGRYRLDVVPCWGFDLCSADLTRYDLVPVPLDTGRVHLDRRRGRVDVGVVDVPASGRVMVRSWASQYPWKRVIAPDAEQLRWSYDSPTLLEPGLPAHSASWAEGFGAGPTTIPGDYLFVPGRNNTVVSASTPVSAAVTPEGDPVSLADQGVAGRERLFTFTGTAGSFVYPEQELPGYQGGGHTELFGPDGEVVPDWYYNRGWHLPLDGDYRLYVTPRTREADAPLTLRLRRATVLPPLGYGAAPTRFATGAPGRWVVAEVAALPSPPYQHRFAASAPDVSGDWDAALARAGTARCSLDPRGPMGCGEYFVTTIDAGNPVALHSPDFGAAPHLVVFRPDPGVTGKVDVAVGAPPASDRATAAGPVP